MIARLAVLIALALGASARAEAPAPHVPTAEQLRAIAGTVDAARVEQTVRTLASFGSRVPGYAGHEQARDFVHRTLADILGDEKDILTYMETIKYGVIIVSSLPVLVLYPFLQRYFIKGVLIGSLKG